MATLADQLTALATLSPAQLRAEWRRVYRVPPPRLTADLLLRGIAYRLQERAHGGLAPATTRQLDRIVKRLAQGGDLDVQQNVSLKPGTRLVRTWKGTTYSVLVTNDGFVHADRCFTSLSQTAESITGAHWSGPRFFGVRATDAATGAAATSAARHASAAMSGANG